MYGHLASTQPALSMRVDQLKLPGKQSGCSAVVIIMDEEHAVVQRAITKRRVAVGDGQAAKADLKGFLKAVLKLRNQKAFPPGSAPAELLGAVLPVVAPPRSQQAGRHFLHSTQAAYVSEHNPKAWTEGERVVMVTCPGRACRRSVLQRCQALMPHLLGEEAVLLQSVASCLRKAGIYHVTRTHDGVKDFVSVGQQYIDDASPYREN